jgi:hypothetical protein
MVHAFQVFLYLCIELKLIRQHGLAGYKAANPWLLLPAVPLCCMLTCS